MNRLLVNVAIGPRWLAGQDRLIPSFKGERGLWWRGTVPPGCPPHRAIPYAFKPFALKEASAFSTTLLWLDASMIAGPRPLADLWEKIEQDGYYLCYGGWNNGQWTIPAAYEHLFPGVPFDEARALNFTIPHVVSGCVGLDLRHDIARCFLDEWLRLARTGAFIGPWYNARLPQFAAVAKRGDCGLDPLVLGHRHDQTAASVIAWRVGMKLSTPPEWFSYAPREGEEIDLSRTCVVAAGV